MGWALMVNSKSDGVEHWHCYGHKEQRMKGPGRG